MASKALKTFLVSGGASGLGEATVRAFASKWNVAILDIDEARGANLAQELGDRVTFYKTDVTSEQEVAAAVDGALSHFGTLNGAVNCGGIGIASKVLNKNGPHDWALFNQVIQVNLCGSFNVIRLAADRMRGLEPDENGERGVFINTASVAAFDGQIGQAAYSASKGGINAMTLPLSRELAAYGIRVNCIAPGIFDTPMLALLPEKARASLAKQVPFPPRLGNPQEYARLAVFMAETQYVNGECVRIDGGIRMAAM